MATRVDQNNTESLIMQKKKLKKKRKKLKEELSLWKESRRPSDEQNAEPEDVATSTEDGKISKQGTGM